MFKEIYATMNKVLDDIIKEYSEASSDKAEELDDQLHLLKAMNDSCLEEWTRFEERLNLVRKKWKTVSVPKAALTTIPHSFPDESSTGSAPSLTGSTSEHFIKGQGYYKLYMFRQAIAEFSELVKHNPDFVLGRVYLAMGYLRAGDLNEAHQQFQLLIPLTENQKLKAISFSAMGCIQLQGNNAEKAFDYFKMADLADSSCMEPSLWSKEFWPFRRDHA
ncbi:hypothetical protein [Gorillibacterium massiliense]|uniref:hypothetical protein n=1 Tax=Gorillibacterium massiliense TaxID=1280390 RepID=UPI0004AE3B52|nr:hypothetical protein [Gorillibacterium massiliense]